MPSKYSINDLERLTGIKAHTLRIWEQRYNILHPKRTSTNIRYYNNSDLKRILNISLLNNHGYKISKIATLNDEEIVKEAEKLFNEIKNEGDQIEKLVFSLMEMNAFRFDEIFAESTGHFGFENTIEKIILPFLRHVGNMWQVGTIVPAQEHFISNLVKQKLARAIDTLPANNNSKKIIFFLPYGEYHEIALLYCCYVAKNAGYNCIYLGPNVPAEDLQFLQAAHSVSFFVSVITTRLEDVTLSEYLRMLSDNTSGAAFLLSGRFIFEEEKNLKLPKNFKVFSDFTAFRKLL